jgi:hypothetical protein
VKEGFDRDYVLNYVDDMSSSLHHHLALLHRLTKLLQVELSMAYLGDLSFFFRISIQRSSASLSVPVKVCHCAASAR